MSVTASTPIDKPTLIDPAATSTQQISNGTPAAASPERIAERYERWLMTQKKLDLGGSIGMVKIPPNSTVTFPIEIRRQGWTIEAEFVVWIASFKAGKAAATATLKIETADDPTGETFVVVGTASVRASDAVRYSSVLPIGDGDRDDEQTVTTATLTIEISAGDVSDLYVYGRTVRQIPYRQANMELAP
jgi:hypothetical protein